MEVNGNRFGDDSCRWWEDDGGGSGDEYGLGSDEDANHGDDGYDDEDDEQEGLGWEGSGDGSVSSEAEPRSRRGRSRRLARNRLQLVRAMQACASLVLFGIASRTVAVGRDFPSCFSVVHGGIAH